MHNRFEVIEKLVSSFEGSHNTLAQYTANERKQAAAYNKIALLYV